MYAYVVALLIITVQQSLAFLLVPFRNVPLHRSLGGTGLHAMQVKIRIVGRRSEKWIEEAFDIYQKRLRAANVDVDTVWYKSDDSLVKAVTSDYD